MLVRDILEDARTLLAKNPWVSTYAIAGAQYTEAGGGSITLTGVTSCNWDEDEEFFLVPKGSENHFSSTERLATVAALIELLEAHPELHEYAAYIRERVGRLSDGAVASLNTPLWGTGVHDDAKCFYCYFGKNGSPF